MAACLRARGVSVEFSSDPEVLLQGQGYDVIRTHGDLLPKGYFWKVKRGPLRVHTLHGSALGKMHGQKEWHRFRHIKSFLRETVGVWRADLIATIHPALGLFRLGRVFGRPTVVHWNGWDGIGASASPAPDRAESLNWSGSWVLAGRLADRMKGADRAFRAVGQSSDLQLVLVPGDGVQNRSRVLSAGRLNPAEIRDLLPQSNGLVLPSRYEGLSLLLLEALAAGVPVVASRVGGNLFVEQCQPRGLQWFTDPDDPAAFLEDLQRAQAQNPRTERGARAEWNQAHLWNWQQCTDLLLERVQAMVNPRRP